MSQTDAQLNKYVTLAGRTRDDGSRTRHKDRSTKRKNQSETKKDRKKRKRSKYGDSSKSKSKSRFSNNLGFTQTNKDGDANDGDDI